MDVSSMFAFFFEYFLFLLHVDVCGFLFSTFPFLSTFRDFLAMMLPATESSQLSSPSLTQPHYRLSIQPQFSLAHLSQVAANEFESLSVNGREICTDKGAMFEWTLLQNLNL